MREYGQIQCSFWQRASEEGWSNDAMILGAYLLTGPHSNGIGCYRLPDGYISDDLGWVPERVTQTLSELFRKGFCNRFGTVVLIPKFLRWNPISNANVAKAREQEFEAIPNEAAKSAAALALLEFGNHWGNGFRNRLETLSKGFAKQNPTQPNPTLPIESAIADLSPAAPEDVTEGGEQEQANVDKPASPGRPPCPHQAIIGLYHELLPSLPAVREWNDTRMAFLRKRWNERPERQSLDWWRRFFAYVSASDFLMGRTVSRDGRSFECDLEWLIRPTNFAKVIEGRYQNREAA